MTFRKIASILDEKKQTHPTLREAATLQKIQGLWESNGLSLFPKAVQQHMKDRVSVGSFQKGTVTFFVKDSQLATTMHIKKSALQRALQKKNTKFITEIRIQIHSR